MRNFLKKILSPSKARSVLQIVGIMLVAVGFALKRDIAIRIAGKHEPHQPFAHIEHIKGQHPQFAHLPRVNLLVPDVDLGERSATPHEYPPQQVDSPKRLRWQKPIFHNLYTHNLYLNFQS